MKHPRMFVIIAGLAYCTSSVSQPHEPDFRVTLQCLGTLYRTCIDSVALPRETAVFLYRDWNGNGPDASDNQPCTYQQACILEEAMVNRRDFFTHTDGSFVSPVINGFFATWGDNHFYVRIFVGEDEDSCWTSPTFRPIGQEWITVDLPVEEWSCGLSPVSRPACLPSLLEVLDLYWQPLFQSYCVESCPGGRTLIGFYSSSGVNPYRPPICYVEAGCDIGCEPVDSLTFSQGQWRNVPYLGWMNAVTGGSLGCLIIRVEPEIAIGHIDTLIAVRTPGATRLDWTTSAERDLAFMDIWRRAAPTEPRSRGEFVVTITAAGDSTGAEYMHVDSTASEYAAYMYSIVLVGADATEYAGVTAYTDPFLETQIASPRFTVSPELSHTYPNPFNASTQIVFTLPREMRATLGVFDVLGRQVSELMDDVLPGGEHRVTFDARDEPSGVYFVRLEAGGMNAVRKILLLR